MTLTDYEAKALFLCAFRYAIGRKTGISFEISELLIKHKDSLPEWVRAQIVRDIELEADRLDDYDRVNWSRVVESFEE